VLVDLRAEAAEAAAAQLHDSRALGLAADVTDRGALQQAVATTVERFGALDVVVANAGIAGRAATFRAMATESFERVIEVNLMGVVRTVEATLPQIVPRGGHAVLVSSIYAFSNGAGATPYAMSKAAVEQLGRALRVELAQHGASATVAYFGYIDTEMVHRSIDEDPVVDAVRRQAPRVLQKRLPPRAAGEAIVRAIERRAPRVIRPRRWAVLSTLRGIVNPLLDRQAERDAQLQAAVRDLDARAGEEQPTTA
jgi:NAD(P)-dependent dehydrogenase (short-subunit alcohol dehydrogenase family)